MDESYAIRRYEQAAALLPLRWQQQARQLPPRQMARGGGAAPAGREAP